MKKIALLIFVSMLVNAVNSQSVYTINNTQPTGGTNFANFNDAAAFLNSLTIPAEGVVFNVVAGQEFKEQFPVSFLNKSGSATGKIIFQKQGDGSNPIVMYDSPGASDTAVRFVNCSYVVWDGIDITDSNTVNGTSFNTALCYRGSNFIEIKNSKIYNFGKIGIMLRQCGDSITINNCEIFYTQTYNIPADYTSIYGIYADNTGIQSGYVINGTKIYGFKVVPSSIYGIYIKNASTKLTNNFISFVENNNQQIQALRFNLRAGQIVRLYNNTIVLEGIAKRYTQNPVGTCLLLTSSSPTPDYTTQVYSYNNIFVNKRVVEEGVTAEQTNINIGATNIDYTFDYNLYENLTAGQMFIKVGSFGYYTIPQWNNFSSEDFNSTIATIGFVNKNNGDLHIAPAFLGKYRLRGIPLVELTTDIDGETRDLTVPYKGADENILHPIDVGIVTNYTSLDFGSVLRMDSLVIPIYYKKINNNAGQIDSIVVSSDFFVSLDSIVWSKKLTNITVNTIDSTKIYVLFSPNSIGLYSSMLYTYLSNENILPTQLTGQGLPRGLFYSPTTLDFGTVDVFDCSDTLTITLVNDGTQTASISSIICPEGYYVKLEGTDIFTQSIGQLDINTNGDTILYVIFKPLVYKDYTDSIEINFSDLINIKVIGHGRVVNTSIQTLGQGVNFGDAAFGDYNNDGLYDIAYIGYNIFKISGGWIFNSGRSFLYKNNGDFNFEKLNINLTKYALSAVTWADYDNDGYLDLFMTGRADSIKYTATDSSVVVFYKTSVYKNNQGTLTPVELNITPLQQPSMDWADYNLDGKVDFLITGKDTTAGGLNYMLVYKNEGNGDFSAEFMFEGVTSGEARWGDYNNDGYPDIAITGKDNTTYITKIYKNLSGNDFQLVFNANPGLRYSRVDWGDYDNDGDLDLLNTGTRTNEEDAHGYIYRNDGNDQFTKIPLPIGCKQGDSRWIDIDNDGDLDLIFNGLYQYTLWVNHIMQNNNGQFDIVYADTSKALENADLTIGDLNGDYTADYLLLGKYLPGDYRSYIYKNNLSVLNSRPNPPTNLAYTQNGNYITLSWQPATDLQTPSQALTYNLKIGTAPGLGDIFNSHTQIPYPWLLKPQRGNVGTLTSITIKIPQANRYYASVQAIDNSYNPSDWSNEVFFDILVDIDQKQEKTIIIYPNPVKDFITVDLKEFSQPTVSIINQLGQRIYIQTTTDKQIKIDLRNYPSGTYYINVFDQNYSSTQKFIKH